MNERMAELFGKAGISDSINEEFGIEYLAELIIQECLIACIKATCNVNGKLREDGIATAMEEIRKLKC